MAPDHDSVFPRFVLPALAPLFVCAGCAEPQLPPAYYAPSKPAVVFPTRAEIAQLPALPALPQVFGTKDVAVEEWSVESPPLPSEGAYDDTSAWGSLLRDLTKTRTESVSLSPAMRCAAAEIGRFHLKNRALPVESLRRFILARCGGETTNLSPFVWFVDAPPAVSDEQIIARARDALANAIEEPLSRGHHLVGLAAARDARHVSVALAIGEDEVRLEPGTRSVDASRRVTLRGTARGEYAHILGLANRGDFGVSRCQNDPSVHPPLFAMTCELAQGDAFNWVTVVGEKRGRVLLHPLADVLVYEGDAHAIAYKVKSYGAPAPVTALPELTSALVDRINVVRAAAGLQPLALAAKQSVENQRLAGTILNASVHGNDDTADKAAIGLLAGWDVEGGMIRGGQFFLGAVAPTHDAMAWVESAVERPSGRMALLDPDARMIAVGPSIPEGGQGLGAAVTTYSLFGPDDHAADEELFFRRIKEARAAHGLAPPVRVASSDDMRKLAARVLHDDATPMGALNEMVNTSSWHSSGFVLEANDLASIDVPDIFLRRGPLPLALAVTHHRAPGAAWGQYVVFALLPAADATPSLQAVRTGRRTASAIR